MLEERVLFIDGEAIVIDKPAGLSVHAGPRTRESVEDHLHHLRFGFMRPPAPVHRLDRDTSGCLLLARNPKAHRRFQKAFEAGVVEKVYAAVLAGVPGAESGTIDLPLAKVSTREEGWRMVADPSGKASRTRFEVVGGGDGMALVLFYPETGRTHQVRAHAAYGLGAPVAGDPVYGRGGGPMLLHALGLTVPRGGKPPVAAQAPLPPHFEGWSLPDAA
jgi:tRNA pseudouridine32 synthase/23S rRNA pseudouridine746 synthase